jgi:dipeptidyl aminopeptidase/acylaminoacyl peptidase
MPAVIHVHGGPGDESRIGYRPLVQYLVNHGYVVFEINNRGSSGSGRSFYHLDDRRHGSADLDDVVAAKTFLASTGLVDRSRVAIQGQSYGGFMTLAGLAFRPNEFAAGVDLYGVSNWPRLLAATPSWWEDLRRLLFTEVGDPERDGEYLRKISPVLHADRIRRPLLVLQGKNDPRVLPVESEDIVAKVRANGVPVEYVLFRDEGHGFRKKANLITAYRAILQFLDRHVKGAPAR